MRSQGGLEALALVEPEMVTPVGFIHLAGARPSRALQVALVLARQPRWLEEVARHSGALAA